jgi:hypothetical protein
VLVALSALGLFTGIESGIKGLWLWSVVILLMCFRFIPTIVAYARKHPRAGSVFTWSAVFGIIGGTIAYSACSGQAALISATDAAGTSASGKSNFQASAPAATETHIQRPTQPITSRSSPSVARRWGYLIYLLPALLVLAIAVWSRIQNWSTQQEARANSEAIPRDSGDVTIERGKYPEAVVRFSKGCEGGDSKGCSSLGYMYEHGYGVESDYPHAISLYSQACNSDLAIGCRRLGFMYVFGRSVTPDVSRERLLFSKGCALGDKDACTGLKSLGEPASGFVWDGSQEKTAVNPTVANSPLPATAPSDTIGEPAPPMPAAPPAPPPGATVNPNALDDYEIMSKSKTDLGTSNGLAPQAKKKMREIFALEFSGAMQKQNNPVHVEVTGNTPVAIVFNGRGHEQRPDSSAYGWGREFLECLRLMNYSQLVLSGDNYRKVVTREEMIRYSKDYETYKMKFVQTLKGMQAGAQGEVTKP